MTDAKINTLYDKYRQYGSIKQLSKNVEDKKKKAVLLGAGTSLALFIGNEFSRLTLRSPLFRLKPVPVILVLAGPTAFLKYVANDDIQEEVAKYWRVHKNREAHGLGGAYNPSGIYNNLIQDNQMLTKFPRHMTHAEILFGESTSFYPNTPASRINSDMEEYPDFHEDYDRNAVMPQLEAIERHKPFMAKKGSVKLDWFIQPLEDTDTKPMWGGPEGDHPFADAPDVNFGPVVDHALDEKLIWNFRRSPYNQDVIDNMWTYDPEAAGKRSSAPFWSKKLTTPAWFKKEKLKEFYAQMAVREEFKILQAKFALRGSGNGSVEEAKRQEKEAQDFIKKAYQDKGNYIHIFMTRDRYAFFHVVV